MLPDPFENPRISGLNVNAAAPPLLIVNNGGGCEQLSPSTIEYLKIIPPVSNGTTNTDETFPRSSYQPLQRNKG